MVGLADVYGRIENGSKARVARYALAAMDDKIESTWRAGYDLFRSLTQKSLGSETGPTEEAERARITHEAHVWIDRDAPGK